MPGQRQRPSTGDLVRHRRLPGIEAEVVNWLGHEKIEVRIVLVPAGLRGQYPPNSLQDEPWRDWDIVKRARPQPLPDEGSD